MVLNPFLRPIVPRITVIQIVLAHKILFGGKNLGKRLGRSNNQNAFLLPEDHNQPISSSLVLFFGLFGFNFLVSYLERRMYPHYNQRNGLPVTTVPLNISMINANKTPFYQPQMVMAVPVSQFSTFLLG